MRQDQARADLNWPLEVDRVLGDQQRSPEPEHNPRAGQREAEDDRRMEARVLDQAGHEHQRELAW